MNTVYASIYWYLPQLLSLLFCSFPGPGVLPPWLNLFLGTLFFLLLDGISPLVFLSNSSLLVYKNAINLNIDFVSRRTAHFTY